MVVAPAALAIISGGMAIVFNAKGLRGLFYIFKPLTLALIILVAFLGKMPLTAAYKVFILAGLVCSLAGDVFLMLAEKYFPAGLASFLAAHVFYILAFRSGAAHPLSVALLLPFGVFGLLIFRTLAPSLGRLKLPVFVYTAAITVMAYLAADRFIYLGGTPTLLALAGAILFLTSDSVLAFNRFLKPLSWAQVVILGTYFPAQLLIALSI
jgi:uncharacterized membrane protein YhhN